MCFPIAEAVEVSVTDWAAMPLSGNITLGSGLASYMSRVNFIRSEPGNAGRLWACDLNGNLHIFDSVGSYSSRSAQLLGQATSRTAYLNFNGQAATADLAEKVYVPDPAGTSTSAQAPAGLFPLFTKRQGYANGLVSFEFDPGYQANGKFYTIHIESISADGAAERLPVTTNFPGLDVTGYASTAAINPPGPETRQAVLIEWADEDPENTTFEGTARELLRVAYTSHIHPLADITFDPAARPGDAEWGVMYLASGDGGAGEMNNDDDGLPGVTPGDRHFNPQRLDTLVGKILRIIPDLSLHSENSFVSANGRYRIPEDNPFTDAAMYPGACKEIWTYGHRNPHRFTWHVSEGNPQGSFLLVEEIGLNGWEEVNLVKRGGNYGYGGREGPQKLTIHASASQNQKLGPRPSPDELQVRIGSTTLPGSVVPESPLIAYPHTSSYGDAISNGFIYRGSGIPALQGKFIFADITTGRLFSCPMDAMLAADDGNPDTLAVPEAITLIWNDPYDNPDAGPQSYSRFFEIVQAGYDHRGGIDADLPGGATISGTGRADIRLAVDAEGELLVMSKSDGIIRRLSGAPAPEFADQPDDRVISLGSDTTFAVTVVGNATPDYQWQRLQEGSDDWLNVVDSPVYSGATTAMLKLDSPAYGNSGDQYRCVATTAGASSISAAAELVVRALPSSWLTSFFNTAERANLSISGDDADPDRDGLVNLLEYAFGFNPEVDSSSVMPKLGKSGANITLTFPTPRGILRYRVERSADLVSWSGNGVTTSTASGSMTASCPVSTGPQAFLRIAVEPK